jgi:predicted transcriptional regulator
MSNKIVRVRDVMKKNFDLVEGVLTIREALSSMKHPETRALVVNKRNEDDEYGLVTLADIASEVLAKNRAPERVNVYEIMVKPALSIHPDMDIRYCARMLKHYKVLRAPVIENGTVIGVVGFTDIVLRGMCDPPLI